MNRLQTHPLVMPFQIAPVMDFGVIHFFLDKEMII
ncbi:MAG: hypothetical protein DDT18_01840 [Actinobacteria bacterium]|nr:hypothetical protein [Actinomycetota bacterium]